MRALLLVILTAVTIPQYLLACPLIDGELIDFNCNQNFKVAMTGDSIARGVGDTRNNDNGGYVIRLKRRMGYKFTNLGDPGATSDRLLRDFMDNNIQGKTKKRTLNVDIVIIDIGRNNYWKTVSNSRPRVSNPDAEALSVARDIKKLITFLKKDIRRRGLKVKPLFIVSTLIPTNRGFQQPFVDKVNQALIQAKKTGLPVFLKFHKNFTTSIISDDNLHPDSKGYNKLSKYIERFLRNKAQVLQAARRPDRDHDGIFDRFEARFGTDPDNPDTDGDSILDGADVFGDS